MGQGREESFCVGADGGTVGREMGEASIDAFLSREVGGEGGWGVRLDRVRSDR